MTANDILAALWRMDENQRCEAFRAMQGQFCVMCGNDVPTWDCYCGDEE